MGLRLHTLAPRQGWTWIVRAAAVWRRRPLSFIGLFSTFLFTVVLLMSLVPVVGGLLGMALVPLLSLGFMIATRSVLAGGQINAAMFVAGLRTPERPRRRSQWLLCGAYAAASVGVVVLSDGLDGGSLETLMQAMAKAPPDASSPAVAAALADPQLALGLLLRTVLAAALSVPFWHASALVHWHGQGAVQALFSSTLAVWRNRSAFLVYGLGWALVMLAVSLLSMLLVLLLGSKAVGFLAMLAGLALSALFYVSLWFSFADSFGDSDPAPGAATA